MEGSRKQADDMSRDELISVVKDKAARLQVAEELFKNAEEEKQNLLVRVSQMIDHQRKQLDGTDGITEKITAERDLLKTKALELIGRGKAAQAKIIDLTAEVTKCRSELQASEASNQALRREMTSENASRVNDGKRVHASDAVLNPNAMCVCVYRS
jgi:hypothetical protein